MPVILSNLSCIIVFATFIACIYLSRNFYNYELNSYHSCEKYKEPCEYYKEVNITITRFELDRYVGKYIYKHSQRECILHDYHDTPNFGDWFIGYVQEDLLEKCVTKEHGNKYIRRIQNHLMNGLFMFPFIFSTTIGTIFILLCVGSIFMGLNNTYGEDLDIFFNNLVSRCFEPTYERLNQEDIEINERIQSNSSNISNWLNLRERSEETQSEETQKENKEERVTEFKSISNQINSNHYVITANYDDICIYCQDKLLENKQLIGLPCGHWFHNNCIDTYSKNRIKEGNFNCPICSSKV